ncbi:glutamate--cysteine ligase [Nocardioides marmotae]|uniref:carboxylate-amine ligase n=1 Tax=Nocardioides marmotae TaxID=2663857 RepID=UPI0013298689|nr:glutamate--cysteine ligase [Nocardioides marmotae]MBC9734423.1 glutamate--cysteine ligase [Nocardioides marmotae]MTB85523.1 YbdK family carboxylate-amine ligase [Nocardioides marmotae]
MEPRTVGVEEELLLIDPETREAAPRAPQVLAAGSAELDQELFRHQVEVQTQPTADLDDLRRQLLRSRRLAAEAAGAADLWTAAVGTSPLGGEPVFTREDRYLDMSERYGEVARPEGTCGMHVHVAIDSPEEGVVVLDGLVPWLPALLAISANSPYHEGSDTRHASWRSQVWSRWPSAGPTERFGSLERYREVSRLLIASGAARDDGMLYFDARLSADHPTVEVRVADVCTDPDDAVLVAALVRALVTHVAAGADRTGRADRAATDPPADLWRVELVRAAQWRAARYGLAERLLDPCTAEPVPARDVLRALVATVREELEAAGDLDRVEDGVARVLAAGGAPRQRAAYERAGGSLAAVVDDLVARTNIAWRD